MIRLYTSEVEAATALASPEVVNELLDLGFMPTTGVDVVSKNRIGNLLAMARVEDDVIAFIALSSHPTITFASLLRDGGLLFTSNSPHESVAFPKIRYVSQKFHLPLPDLLARHLDDVDGQAGAGHSDPYFALALQRRHAEVNEARRVSARWGLQFINGGALASVVATGWFMMRVLFPLIEDGLSPVMAGLVALPAAALVAFAFFSNFSSTPYGRPLTQYIGLTLGAGLPDRSLEETLAMGDMVETGR